MKIRTAIVISALVVVVVANTTVQAQSSSLYLLPGEPAVSKPVGRNPRTSPSFSVIAQTSFAAVGHPPERKFAIHDLVTIIVRESITNDSKSTLETAKTYTKKGKITAAPRFRLKDFLNLQLNQSKLAGNEPQIGVEFDTEWEGEGTHKQRNTFTARITSRIIDIKPNGTLVLEARKRIKTDSDNFSMVVTGTCRKQDISANNTILSEQIADLSVVKQHTGELRKASKKGWITKVFEAIFNF